MTHPGAQYLAELEAAITEYDEGMALIGGCGDGNCLIVKPVGMHTNGGCRCYTDKMTAQRAMARGSRLAASLRPRIAAIAEAFASEKARADAAEADLKRINGFAQKYKRHHAAVLEERDALIREKSQSSWGEFNRLKTMYSEAEATIASLTAERDALKRERDELKAAYSETLNSEEQWITRAETAERDLAAAVEALDEIEEWADQANPASYGGLPVRLRENLAATLAKLKGTAK